MKLLMHYSKNLYEGLAGPVSSPGTMSSTSTPDRGTVCAVNPFDEGFRFQSSQPNLKRFVMFDHSGGKGRVFFHPVLTQELFGPAQHRESNGVSSVKEHSKPSTNLPSLKVAQSDLKLKSYREVGEGAFTSLQTLRSSRTCELASKHQQISNPMVSETLASSGKPGVSDAIGTARYPIDLEALAMAHAQSLLASGILDCEEKHKVSAALPSPERLRASEALASSVLLPFTSRSQLSGTKRPVETTAGERMRENTEDLDALLSSDEDDDDEEVRSTGHSPDEPLGKEESCNGDEDNAVLQFTSKKRRVDEQEGKISLKGFSSGEEVNDKGSFEHRYPTGQSSRRHKIKRTVKALRRMIPGGAFLDAALVLDETIHYVKILRERVSQLEATRFQNQA